MVKNDDKNNNVQISKEYGKEYLKQIGRGLNMENLKREINKEYDKTLMESLARIETEEGLKGSMERENKKYVGKIKYKFAAWLKLQNEKRRNAELKKIEEVENVKDFGGELVITVEWKNSRMWRSNPTAWTNYGFKGSSIGGCGYDKQSTATAEALNSHLPLLKLLYQKKDREISAFKGDKKNGYNREILGYGSGYGILPQFEGGVGVDCHKRILEGVGVEMRTVTNTNNTDVFLIKRK